MGFLDNLRENLYTAPKVTAMLDKKQSFFNDTTFFGIPSNGEINTETKEGQISAYEKISIVSACTDALARDCSRPFMITDKKDKEVQLKSLDEELYTLLTNKYNGDSLSLTLKKHIIPHLLLTGNAFYLKMSSTMWGKKTNKNDTLVPISPQNVGVLVDETGLFIKGYVIKTGNTTRTVEPKDIVHFKLNCVNNSIVGVGMVAKAKYIIQTENLSDQYANNFMKNSAKPSMAVLDGRDMSPEEGAYNKELLTGNYAGAANAGNMMYMYGATDVKIIPLSFNNKDIQFIEQKDFTRQQIMSLFSVPPVVLGIPDGSNRAIAQTFLANYLNIVCNNMITELEETFNSQLMDAYNRDYKIVFEKYSQADTQEIAIQVQSGIIYRNEAREALGWSIIEGDEEIRDINKPAKESLTNSQEQTEEEKLERDRTAKGIEKKKESLKSELMIERFRKSMNAMEAKYIPQLKKFFTEQGQRVAKRLETGKKATGYDTTWLFEGELELLKEELQGLHLSGLTRATNDVNKVYDQDFDSSTRNVMIRYNLEKLGKRITGIDETTRSIIVGIIDNGVTSGQTIQEMQSEIASRYTNMAAHRPAAIARTESRTAYFEAQKDNFAEMGVTKMSIIGCSVEEAGYDCNRKDFTMEEYDGLNLHVNCTGALVAED